MMNRARNIYRRFGVLLVLAAKAGKGDKPSFVPYSFLKDARGHLEWVVQQGNRKTIGYLLARELLKRMDGEQSRR